MISGELTKLDCPRFNGDDVEGWKYRCEQFFLIDETPENRKVCYATIKFDGKALHWYQVYRQISGKELMDMRWDDFSRSTLLHFGGRPEMKDATDISFLQFQETLKSLQTAIAKVEADVARMKESFEAVEIELFECKDSQELKGIHSDSSDSLYCDNNNLVDFVDKDEVNSEKETSAYKVFAEIPERIHNEIGTESEAQYSDIHICETILSEISEQKYMIEEVSEYQKDTTIITNVDVLDASSNIVADVLDASSNIVFRHFEDKIGSLSLGVPVKDYRGEDNEFQSFDDIVCFGDFWGQKSLKTGVLDVKSFGWKPGWLHTWIVINSFAWNPGWNNINEEETSISLEDWLDMEINGVVDGVKDIKEIVCLENGSIVNVNVVVESNDVNQEGKGWVRTKRSFGDIDYDKDITEWVEDSGVYISEDVVFAIHSDAEYVQNPVECFESQESINESGSTPNAVNKRDEFDVSATMVLIDGVKRQVLIDGVKRQVDNMCIQPKSESIYHEIMKKESVLVVPLDGTCTYRKEVFTPGAARTKEVLMNFETLKNGCLLDSLDNVAVLDHYANLNTIEEKQMVFGDTSDPNVVPYIALVCGYLKKEKFDDALKICITMPGENATISGYSQKDLPFNPGIGFWKVLHDGCHYIWMDRKPAKLKIADFGLTRAVTLPTKKYTRKVLTFWYRAREVFVGVSVYSNWYNNEVLWSFMVWVVQEPGLLSENVKEKVTYMRKNTPEFEIIQAVSLASIIVLKDGYKTVCGETGIQLSFEYSRDLQWKMIVMNQGVQKSGNTILYLEFKYRKTEIRECSRSCHQTGDNVPLEIIMSLMYQLVKSVLCMKSIISLVYARVDDQLGPLGIHWKAATLDEEVELDTYISENMIVESTVELKDSQCQSKAAVDNATQRRSDQVVDSASNIEIIEANANVFYYCEIEVVESLFVGFMMNDKPMFCERSDGAYLQKRHSAFRTERAEPESELSAFNLHSPGLPYKKEIRIQKHLKDRFWLFLELHKGNCEVASLDDAERRFQPLIFEDKNLIRGKYCYISKYSLAISVINDIRGTESIMLER